jgi:hypothetical protein
VRLVISDTGPINYLVLIGHIDLLPILFERVIMPVAVLDELADADAPPPVGVWIANPPNWIEVRESPASFDDAVLAPLDDGERAAIALAALHPELLLLMDDREGFLSPEKKDWPSPEPLAFSIWRRSAACSTLQKHSSDFGTQHSAVLKK